MANLARCWNESEINIFPKGAPKTKTNFWKKIRFQDLSIIAQFDDTELSVELSLPQLSFSKFSLTELSLAPFTSVTRLGNILDFGQLLKN